MTQSQRTRSRQDIYKYVWSRNNLTRTEVEDIVDAVFAYIIQSAKEGFRVQIYNFGAFAFRPRAARSFFSARLNRICQVPARSTLRFYPSPKRRIPLDSSKD